MAEHGLLDVTDAGSARLYTLNREHVAASAAMALLDLRGQLFNRIRHGFERFPVPPVAAAVFGSASRGDGSAGSDIDVFVVRPEGVDDDDQDWAAAIDKIGQDIRRWTGNYASTIQAAPEQVAAMIARAEPIVAELRRDAVAVTDGGVLQARPEGAV